MKVYLPAYNKEFTHKPLEEGSAFIPWAGSHLEDILCEQHERTVSSDNCVSFEGMTLQIPPDKYRCHYVRVKVKVHRYTDRSLAVFHGPVNGLFEVSHLVLMTGSFLVPPFRHFHGACSCCPSC